MTSLLAQYRPLALAGLMVLALAPGIAAQTASYDDLRALRYYLTQNDAASTQAELRRLRGAFPDWRPPADLNELLAAPPSQAGVDEGEIWRRIELNDYAGARRLIDDGRARVSGWSPPADMLRVLEMNEAQSNFDAAVNSRDAGQAIAVARRSPQIMTCERINNAWVLADMYVLAGQTQAALTTYRNAVQSCTSFGQMQTSLQKASAVASGVQLQELFAAARAANSGASAQLDRLYAELTGGAPAPQPAAAAPQQQAPAPAAQPVASPPAAAQPQAVAAPLVMEQPATAPANLPLSGDPRLSEARRLKDQEQFARCLAASTGPRSLDLLYERSWCAYSHDRPTEALVGFQQAARVGDRLGPNVGRDAVFGLALSYLAMNMTEQGAQVASQVSLDASQRREIETIVLDQRGVRAFRQGDFHHAISYFNALEQVQGGLRRDLAILRAYAYLNSGQRVVAREQFERLHSQLATAETRQGLNAARGP
ncbi:hypothetical protein [Roseinatronobacter alkalisoli]|uniref:Tetratricopeptide repeat protein n=1 Tax=Roseinatronobacter alkalisoli TaxID=3028235 RepID=A0ABT5T5U4_9RHOB|nr:hypothetical protein [Roseinatronobacter sp. HJB301]MDD7969781.1 hypothetical protein [Roseinatronobacter sp. HJB301]